MTARRRGALLFTGLLLFAGGLVTGYALGGAQLTTDDAGETTSAATGSASPPTGSAAPSGEGESEPVTAASSNERAAPEPTDPPATTGGRGAPPETIGAERDPMRAPSTSEPAERAEQVGPHDGGVRPRGRLDASAIRDVVRDHRDQLGFCFAWQLHSNPALRGRITMSFTIGEDGRVTRAEVLDDQLGDETVLRCFRSVTARMRFPPPEGGEVSVHYPFLLSPDDEQAE